MLCRACREGIAESTSVTSDSSERLASDAAQPSVGGWDPKAASLSRACSTPPPSPPPSLLLSPPLHSPPLPSFRGQKPNKPHLFPDSSYLDLTVVTPSSRAVLLNQIETKQVPSPGFCPAATRHLWLGRDSGSGPGLPRGLGAKRRMQASSKDTDDHKRTGWVLAPSEMYWEP